jgi:hypothetical protein
VSEASSPDPVHHLSPDSPFRYGTSWDWRKPRRGDPFRTCSYCGSVHPEDLAAIPASDVCAVCGVKGWYAHFEQFRCHMTPGLECEHEPRCHPFAPAGWYASWADRKYGWPHKFYVEGLRPTRPGMVFCLGHSSHEQPSWGNQDHWVAAAELTRSQKSIIRSGGMHSGGKFEGYYLFEPRATVHGKFYTAHLADPAVSDEAREKIAQACGLRFRFLEDGRVGWCPVTAEPHEHSD